MRKLPFLNGIKAFEAAARSGSFTKAAGELHVTPAAISRMVQLLEQRLGVPLFERKANRLTPTAAGRAYQAGLTQLFDQLANLTAHVTAMAQIARADRRRRPDVCRALAHSAARRSAEARAGHRGAVRDRGRDRDYNNDWTCGIRLGAGDWPGFAAERLFAANLTSGLFRGHGAAAEDAGGT